MRNSNKDVLVEKIAKYGGVRLESARKIYEHVFINSYMLSGEEVRFPLDYFMAQSFQRILSGKNIRSL